MADRKRKSPRGPREEFGKCGYRDSINNDPVAKQNFLDRCWVTWYEVGFGVRQYTCFHPGWQCPIAVVWISGTGDKHHTGEILFSFTIPYFRRLGVRKLINKHIFDDFEVIRTPSGSDEGGMAFMKIHGYKWCDIQKLWYLERPKSEE